MKKIKELKKVLKEIHDKYFKESEDTNHKSQEGAVTITYYYGNYFEENYVERKPFIMLEVYSYLFSDEGRRKEWNGHNLNELLQKAIDFFSQFKGATTK